VPVEPEEATHTIAAERVEQAITSRTRAVMPVHLYGQPADMQPIVDLARRRGLKVIEDAAQAQGARYQGRRAGCLGDAAAFSFYPGKNLGAMGDAGALVTDDGDLAARVRRLRNYGSAVKYQHESQGFNARLDELQAAVLRVKLVRLDEWNDRRRAMAAGYRDGLKGVAGLELPQVPAEVEPVWHLFVVRHPRRDELQRHLTRAGVETLIHYPVPPHHSGAYAGRNFTPGGFPIAERIASTVLSLPMGPHLTADLQDRVMAAVAGFSD
jgi:dTDP-4-amino-4,6-dideoxygalactose transaminase